jgi:hypothetical protein
MAADERNSVLISVKTAKEIQRQEMNSARQNRTAAALLAQK